MRPQLFAADHIIGVATLGVILSGFNEAAAIRCGSQVPVTGISAQPDGFNEAAAIRCGSQADICLIPSSSRGFNEAAAIRCGSQSKTFLAQFFLRMLQ